MTARNTYFRTVLALASMLGVTCAVADTPELTLEIRDHLFYPSRVLVPRDQKVKLIVVNNDASPEEFESYPLNREKVVMGNHQITIFIGPLTPGEYPFFGEFHPKTALGSVVVE